MRTLPPALPDTRISARTKPPRRRCGGSLRSFGTPRRWILTLGATTILLGPGVHAHARALGEQPSFDTREGSPPEGGGGTDPRAPAHEDGAPIAGEPPEGDAAAEALRADTTGFYPLWENTGHVERGADVRIGTTGAQVGVGGFLHVGVQPLNFLYRSPNAFAKVSLLQSGAWNVAGHVALFRLLEGASRAFLSPMYSSRLDNPDFEVTLAPISIAVSTLIVPSLAVHQTITGLVVSGEGSVRDRVTPGYSAVIELNPLERHAITLHVAEVGFWTHDLAILGASYRYRNGWLEARLGYFYRFTESGAHAAPLAGLGVLL